MSGAAGSARQHVKFNPGPLVDLARRQLSDRPEVASALGACTHGWLGGVAYIYFVDPARPNEPGSPWQFAENVQLQDECGSYVLDILQDGRIGGIEFLHMLRFTA